MRRAGWAVAVLVVLTGCGGNDSDQAATTTTTAKASTSSTAVATTSLPGVDTDTAALTALLPALTEMPAGWQATPDDGVDTVTEACPGVPRASTAVPARAVAEVNYQRPGTGLIDMGEYASVRVKAFESAAQAGQWISAARTSVDSCTGVARDWGDGITATEVAASPGDVPGVADSFGSVTTLSQDGTPLPLQLTSVVVVDGRYAVEGIASTASEAERWVKATVVKLPTS